MDFLLGYHITAKVSFSHQSHKNSSRSLNVVTITPACTNFLSLADINLLLLSFCCLFIMSPVFKYCTNVLMRGFERGGNVGESQPECTS